MGSESPESRLKYLQGNLGRCPTPIFFVLTYVVVLQKLSDTYFFLCAQNDFQGVKTTPEKCGTKYPFNCFIYNKRIFLNQTNANNVLTIRDEKCDFVNFIKKFQGGKLPQKKLRLYKNRRKLKVKNLEKIYFARDSKIQFTCFCIFTKNYFIGGNHP